MLLSQRQLNSVAGYISLLCQQKGSQRRGVLPDLRRLLVCPTTCERALPAASGLGVTDNHNRSRR